jgi:hypothetical protein
VSPPATPSGDARAEPILALQRTIGNRATARVLARDPRHTGDPPTPPAPSPPMDLQVMSPSTRRVLRNDCRDRILAALPFFVAAVKDNVDAIKAEEKSKAEWSALLIDVILGIGAPIFAKILVNRGGVTGRLAGKMSKVTATTETVTHRAAAKTAAEAAAKFEEAKQGLAVAEAQLKTAQLSKAAARGRRATKDADRVRRDAETAATKAAEAVAELSDRARNAKDAYEKLKPVELIGDAELLKESMKAIGNVAKTTMKQNVELLWGEDDVKAFSLKLEVEFQTGVDDVTHQLNEDNELHPDSEGGHFSDKQLIALWSSFDPELTNVLSYRQVLKEKLDQFKTWVRPIAVGTPAKHSKYGNYGGKDTRAAWLNTPSGKELWLVDENWQETITGEKHMTDRDWRGHIPPEMERFAIAQTEALFGSVETFDNLPYRVQKEAAERAKREAEQKKTQAAEEARRRAAEQARQEEARRQYEILVKQHPEFGLPPGPNAPVAP